MYGRFQHQSVVTFPIFLKLHLFFSRGSPLVFKCKLQSEIVYLQWYKQKRQPPRVRPARTDREEKENTESHLGNLSNGERKLLGYVSSLLQDWRLTLWYPLQRYFKRLSFFHPPNKYVACPWWDKCFSRCNVLGWTHLCHIRSLPTSAAPRSSSSPFKQLLQFRWN